MKWEYYQLMCRFADLSACGFLGDQGWELCGVIPMPFANPADPAQVVDGWQLIFKRVKVEVKP